MQRRKESQEKNEIERNHQLKYRKIKFIEKKKVLRRMEKTRRKIAKTSDPVKLKTLRKDLKSHKDDLEYIEYFPRDRGGLCPLHQAMSLPSRHGIVSANAGTRRP